MSYLDNLRKLYLENHHVFTSAFNPANYENQFGWIAIEDDAYTGQSVPENLQKDLAMLGIHKGSNHNNHELKEH